MISRVPQGSVLGPMLFLGYINNLDVHGELVAILRKFADDMNLVRWCNMMKIVKNCRIVGIN